VFSPNVLSNNSHHQERKTKKMEIKVIVFDGLISKAIARETFASVKELNEFMDIVKQVEPKASYSVLEIKK